MPTRLALLPSERVNTCGPVVPTAKDGITPVGLSVGTWHILNSIIYVEFLTDIDTIKHEVATSKAVRQELRQAEKDKAGIIHPTKIEYDPRTKKFRQVML